MLVELDDSLADVLKREALGDERLADYDLELPSRAGKEKEVDFQ